MSPRVEGFLVQVAASVAASLVVILLVDAIRAARAAPAALPPQDVGSGASGQSKT